MSRVISARHIFKGHCETPGENKRQLLVLCMEAHRQTMGMISGSIANESRPGQSNPELMALLLACAQSCQSATTLLRVHSEHAAALVEACRQTSLACAEACSELMDSLAAQSCAQACRSCADACATYPRTDSSEVSL